jgi:hypothetical protein
MAIIIRKNINEVNFKHAVTTKENLPTSDNVARDTCYVKTENKYYIFNGYAWQEVDLVIE